MGSGRCLHARNPLEFAYDGGPARRPIRAYSTAVGFPSGHDARQGSDRCPSIRKLGHGERFFKLIPAEGHAISAAEAALTIAQQLRLRGLTAAEDGKAVHVRTQKGAMTIVEKHGKLLNAADRDHCLQYIIAVIMLKGSLIKTGDYMDDSHWAQDPRVDSLRRKMTVVEDEGFTRDYNDQKVRSGANAILVQLSNGEILDEVVVEFPIGHPKRDDTLDLVKEKFRASMDNMFHKEEVKKILQAVEFENIPVNEFMGLLTR